MFTSKYKLLDTWYGHNAWPVQSHVYLAPKTCSSTHIKIWQIDEILALNFFQNLYEAKNIVKTRKFFQKRLMFEKKILGSLLYHPWWNSKGAISESGYFSDRNSGKVSWRISMPLPFPSGKLTYLPSASSTFLYLQSELWTEKRRY